MRGRPKINPNRAEKKCSCCHKVKKRSEFDSCKSNHDGLHSCCIACDRVLVTYHSIQRRCRKNGPEHLLQEIAQHRLAILRLTKIANGMKPREATREELKIELPKLMEYDHA